MKGDFSRRTFDPRRHYSGVLMQQGRVQVDADWNEQQAIQLYRNETETRDVIGPAGAPEDDAGFAVVPAPGGADLLVSPGRFYVGGILCELEGTAVAATYLSNLVLQPADWTVDGEDFAPNQWVEVAGAGVLAPLTVRISDVDKDTKELTFADDLSAFQAATSLTVRRWATYATQPDLPKPDFVTADPDGTTPPVLAIPDGTYLLYLDVWKRHLTSLDDDRIREKALGGPDTTTRQKTVWQLRLWPGEGGPAPLDPGTGCGTAVPGWDAATAPSSGRLKARTQPPEGEPNPCILPPSAGYQGLENQLYRVEVHAGGTLGTDSISFKWSRDNGSVVKPLEAVPGTSDFTVSDLGPDSALGLAEGQWVELVDDEVELNSKPLDLFQFHLDSATDAVTLPTTPDPALHPKLRRWDSEDVVTVPAVPVDDGWIELENGIQVQFSPGTYRTGDYWLIPARTAEGDVEWPLDPAGDPLAQPPDGVAHAYARIGVLHVSGGVFTAGDCRLKFPPLTKLKPSASCCTLSVGDGVATFGDYTSIQAALQNLPPEGGEIHILPGRYVENVTIQGGSKILLKGCGDRTQVVSAAPAAGQVAGPVFHVVDSTGIRISSLAVVADPTGIGLLFEGDDPAPQDPNTDSKPRLPSRDHALSELLVTAAQQSAVKVLGGRNVLIENCSITMTADLGLWPAVFVAASDVVVRGNEITGSLSARDAVAISQLRGAAGVSAIQISGGSERVLVERNRLLACSGQGITLGSVVEIQTPVAGTDTTIAIGRFAGILGWAIDLLDPCLTCDSVSTGDNPPDQPPDSPPRFRSAGTVYDVEIRDNDILDMGLDGIGVPHFFHLADPARAACSIRIEDLSISRNNIRRCLRRPTGTIAASMMDSMGYGGIALSFVENLVIRDNRIEENGMPAAQPVSGIFVLYGEGVEIGRNHILSTASGLQREGAASQIGRRGGIHIVHAGPALSEAATRSFLAAGAAAAASPALVLAPATLPVAVPAAAPALAPAAAVEIASRPDVLSAGVAVAVAAAPVLTTPVGTWGLHAGPVPLAAVIEENVVSVPLGQALVLAASGPVSVVSNSLTSRGVVTLNLRALFQDNLGAVNALAHLASLVSVVGLGRSPLYELGGINLGTSRAVYGNVWLDSAPPLASRDVHPSSCEVLIADNQCTLDLRGGKATPGASSARGLLPPSVIAFGFDDVALENNQCLTQTGDNDLAVHALATSLLSVRVLGNRLQETLGHAFLSALSSGIMNLTLSNQANHCLEVWGAMKTAAPNQILIGGLVPVPKGNPAYCDQADLKLVKLLGAFLRS
jgi:hypothetical protein